MLGRWRECVDNPDARAGIERWHQIVKQGIGLSDLVIHVHQDCNID